MDSLFPQGEILFDTRQGHPLLKRRSALFRIRARRKIAGADDCYCAGAGYSDFMSEISINSASLREAGRRACDRPYTEIIDIIDQWAAAWEDPAFPPWKQVRDQAGTNHLIDHAILTLCRSAREEHVWQLIGEQVGDVKELPGLAPRAAGGWRLARGYPLVGVFLGGGAWLASWPVFLLAIIARSAVYARMSEADQFWPTLFQSSLALIDPDLAGTIDTGHWPSRDTDRHDELCRTADLILAYGSDETITSLRTRVPASTPFMGFGSRLSAAVVDRDAALDDTARKAANDIALYDQSGCLSPQTILVEGPAARGREFAIALDRELEAATRDWPADGQTPGQKMAIRTARDLISMEEGGLALGPPDLRWSVLFSLAGRFELSPMGRVAGVRVYESDADLESLLAPWEGMLQAVGVGSSNAIRRLTPILAGAGATRICPIGEMQFPRLSWSHDGRAILTSLIRWLDVDAP